MAKESAAPAKGIGRRLLEFVKTTVVGGVLVLLPISACLYLIFLFAKTVFLFVEPVEKYFPVKQIGGIGVLAVIAIMIVVASAFLLGLLVRTTIGRALSQWFSRIFSKVLPGYSIFKALSRQVARKGDEKLGAPLLVRNGAHRQFGFLVEEHASGEMTVFLPSAPALVAGTVLIVPAECVERLNASIAQVAGCIQTYGVGSAKLLTF